MNSSELEKTVAKIAGLRLDEVWCACEMLMFRFAQYSLHAQCPTRIVGKGDILLTTLDYQSWDEKTDSNNDEWYNLERYKPDIVGGKVSSVKINPLFDLTIELDNDVIIQCFVGNGYAHYGEEREQYRFFEIGPDGETEEEEKLRKHYVVYSKHTEIR